MPQPLQPPPTPPTPFELPEDFRGLACEAGLMTIAGFGSLLSLTSALTTFPQLSDFRQGRLRGWRRVFAHQCTIFHERGIARPETREVSSLSVEEVPEGEGGGGGGGGDGIVVSLFEVEATPEAVAAFVEREHEFRCVRVSGGHRAMVCVCG